MSDKSKNTENNLDSINENKELSPADKILLRIKQKKNQNEEIVEETTKETKQKNTLEVKEEEKLEKPKEKVQTKPIEKTSEKTQKTIIEYFSKNTEEDSFKEIDTKEIEEKQAELSTATEQIEEEDKEIEIDFKSKTKEELLSLFADLLTKDDTSKYEKQVKKIRNEFYNIIKTEDKERREKFIKDEGNIDDYEPIKDEDENKFKELFQKFVDKKETWELRLKEQKNKNLELKYQVVKEIEELINKPETFNQTFNKFKELQTSWNKIGLVPKKDAKPLFDEYNKQVQKFYDYLEVNKELRELDFKKNLDLKIKFCEKAEELLLETNYSKAKKELQNLHKKWKEAGSVSNDKREEIWSRFQAATIKINDKFSEYIEEVKAQQERNLESKQFLVSKAQEASEGEYSSHKEWKDASNRVIELQKLWRKIGYVPKEHNNEIYNQFKLACDAFFVRIRAFYEENEKHRDDNYQKKLDLCNQAESLQASNEWNNTTELYKKIQQEWKEIGPVSQKYSDEIWKRFRKACNTFFNRKKEHFKDKKSKERENLVLKQEIIKQILEFDFSGNQIDDLKQLKEFQNNFTTIGYVPYDKKDQIYKEYHNAIDEQLGKLNISREEQNELKFNENVEIIKSSPGAERLAYNEISKLQKKIDVLNDDIKIWENNIGFFASSKNSESMINNINEKIEKAKENVVKLQNQIDELAQIND